MKKAIVGVDLAVAGPHRAAIVDPETSQCMGKSFAVHRTYEGLEKLLKRVEEFQEVAFVLEPTDRVWKPLASALRLRGHAVYVVSPDRASALRRFLRRHSKTDRIDAVTLAKQLVVAPEDVHAWVMSPTVLSRLKHLCRHRERLSRSIGDRKRRIGSMARGVMPTLLDALGQDRFTTAMRAFLRKYMDPFKVVALGQKRLGTYLRRRHRGALPGEVITGIYAAAESAAQLYGQAREQNLLPLDFEQVGTEIRMELELMEREESMVADLDERIAAASRITDPGKHLQSLPGFGPTIAAAVQGETGPVRRFATVANYRGFVSLIPRKKQSSQTENQHQRVRKNGPRLLKKYFYLAAETARQNDLECAAVYARVRKRGRVHAQAVCAVANKLASRAFAILRSLNAGGRDYEFRDLSGRCIQKVQAARLVKETLPGPKLQRRRAERKAAKKADAVLCTRPPEDASKRPQSDPLRLGQILAQMGAGGVPIDGQN